MSLNLPDRANLEYLKKLAKDRLLLLQATDPSTRLADAQLALAREYGFASWRALKADLDRRHAPHMTAFMHACTTGDVEKIRQLLKAEPGLARETLSGGTTSLHLAVRHPEALRLLLDYGADPNARDLGDNALALHYAAAQGLLDSARILLDAGADVHGSGDAHHGEVIGWASRRDNGDMIALLLSRGARHHIFSAMALSDRDLVRRLVKENQDQLRRRRSRFENGHTPVHAAFAAPDGLGFLAGAPDYAMLDLLIELGADIDATDDKGRTALDLALLRGDRQAVATLRAAGAREGMPLPPAIGDMRAAMRAVSESVRRITPMLSVRDIRATVEWYKALGFVIEDEYAEGEQLVFARVSFGGGDFTLSLGGNPGPQGVTLWFMSDRVQDLYAVLKQHQLRVARDTDGESGVAVRFEEDLYQPFYGGLQFSIRDLNELVLIFWQPAWLMRSADKTGDGAS
jgi:ankyrin repeat protein/catechol 2,3-dioxygenase-like lactoylglutathione lyase family enzyme